MIPFAVFDTNILIEFSFQNQQAQRVLKQSKRRLISAVTWVEFLTGIPAPQMDISKNFLSDMFEIIYPEEEMYELALDLRRQYRLKLPDALIYATAKYYGVPLVTRNSKDFKPSWDDVSIPY